MIPNVNQAVSEIVKEYPGAIRIFESFGIDYCCGGAQSLKEACAAAGLPVEKLLESVAASQAAIPKDSKDWRDASLTALTAHIVEKHHGLVKGETPRLQDLIQKVRDRHGASHPELSLVEESFNAMAEELRSHMLKEEQILFPYIQRLEDAIDEGRPMPRPPFGTVANPIAMMIAEHDSAGGLLKQIRAASQDYALPATACASYDALYRGLEDFECDLHIHIHLENNILFPRAVELERKMLKTSHAR